MVEESIISSVIDTWRRFGVFDFILPFMLVFGIVYGILERTELFGKKAGKSVNTIIAFAIAMTSTLTSWFIGFMTDFLPWVSTISIIVISGLMLIAIFAGDFNTLKSKDQLLKYGSIFIVVSLAVVLLWLGKPIWDALGVSRLDESLNAIGLSVSDLWGLVFFIGFIVALWAVGRGETNGTGGS